MANLFDDITKKVSDVADSAVQLTKDRTDVAKMNSAIFKEQKTLRALYNEIGAKYFELHHDEPEEELRELVEKAAGSKELIDELQMRIMYIRGRRSCPSCDSEMPLNAKFCSVCGIELPAIAFKERKTDNKVPVCEGCGEPIQPEAKFCPYCGREVPAPEDPDTEVIPESETEVVDNEDTKD